MPLLPLLLAPLLLLALLCWWRRKPRSDIPGPAPWPIIGSLHLLASHRVPFEAFTALARRYGELYALYLGSTPTIVVSSYPRIKEVLITKGNSFGGRPDLHRFHMLFAGDRNNSLALCDWSELQKMRRSIARTYCSPRLASSHFDHLVNVCAAETPLFLERVSRAAGKHPDVDVKSLLQAACCNIFMQYMCSVRFPYEDTQFQRVVRIFDEIFWEINQGYAVDFLPWLLPAYRTHMKKLSTWASDIRAFILARIVDERRRDLDLNAEPRDFTDALLQHLEADPHLNWDHVLFELEDFIGGHSAVGNLVMLALTHAAQNPTVAERIQAEADALGGRPVGLDDKRLMPYTAATLLETLRVASSPIVPHVATQDTSISGYSVAKGTVVILNNHALNTSEELWQDPMSFAPERFLDKDGRVVKPEHFIPFSTGKRTCIGQTLVQGCAFVLLAEVLRAFRVAPAHGHPVATTPACVALPPDTFPLRLTPRL